MQEAFPYLESALINNANFGKITVTGLLGIDPIYFAIVFSMALIGFTFFVLEDSYE